jgi:glycosyltransferase involved in cell wall biosynthesis
MRVLHVITTRQRRGAEIFARDLIHALNQEEVKQHVAVISGAPASISYEAPTTVLGTSGRPRTGWVDPAALGRLRRLLRLWRPDVVQAHGGAALTCIVLSSPDYHNPLVYRRIGTGSPRTTRGLGRRLYTTLMKRPSALIAVAEAVRREVIDVFGVPPGKVITIPRGVDAQMLLPTRSRAATRQALGIAPGRLVTLSLGSLTWEKDPLAIVRMLAQIIKERPGTLHIFAGDGPLRRKAELEVQRRDLQDDVIFLGIRNDVADVLAASDLLLLASRIEGMPGCVIEAGMAGLPVVAFSVAGVPEVVRHGETGLLAPPGNENVLARLVLELLDDGGRRTAMGVAASTHCRSLFDIGVIAPEYLKVYGRMAGLLQ